jgi:hypothetical protein
MAMVVAQGVEGTGAVSTCAVPVGMTVAIATPISCRQHEQHMVSSMPAMLVLVSNATALSGATNIAESRLAPFTKPGLQHS